MARGRRAKNSNDTLKYFLIGAAALVVLFLVFNVGPTGKFTGTEDLNANLVAELSFDSEESGTTPVTFHPTVTSAIVSGATLVNDGFLGSAYLFNDPDGDHDDDDTSNKEDLDYEPQNHFIELPGLDGTDFPESGTLSMWIYLDSSESPPATWSKLFDTTANGKNHFWVRQRPDSASAPGGIQVAAQGEFCSKYISGYVFAADNPLNPITDNWINIVLTWDEDTEKFKHYYQGNNKKTYLYRYQNNVIDGITTDCVDGSNELVDSWVPDEQIVKFYGDPWNSKLDEIRIYDIALTEAQVAALYSAYTANQPPTIISADLNTVQIEGTLFTAEVEATDLNNDDTLSYAISITSPPLSSTTLSLSIDSVSGAITVTDPTDGTLPDVSEDTTWTVTVTVTDDALASAQTSFDITVLSDADSDGLIDTDDNCPNDKNPDQSDFDEDNIGDACDDDVDGDTILNTADNCPNDVNSDQANFDGDTLGDECDTDVDDDGVINDDDLCPETGEVLTITIDENGCSESQLDANADSDEDGVINSDDLCPATPIDATVNSVGCPDTDGDGIYDNLDFAWDLTQSGLTTDSEEVEVESYALENNGIFSMNLQSSTGLSASCSDNSNRAQAACEVDQHHWTEAATEACTEIATGTDVTVTYADSTSCLEPGVCSDETITDQSICESAYSCSDSSYSTQITCESADELWGNFWSWILTNTWTSESDAACSDGTSTDQAACEAASVNTWSEASDVLNDLQSATVLVKVEYYDLETNEILSSTIYTSQISIGETSAEAFSISVPQTSTAVSYIATVNVWSGMIGTSDWQPYSEKIELRGEFHP